MKKFLALILTLTCLVSMCTVGYVHADEIEETENTVPAEYTLSLKGAIELALVNNPQLVANEHTQNANKINIKSARMTKSSAEKAQKMATQYGVFSATTVDELCVRKGYYVNAAIAQYDLSVLEKSRIEASIAYNVTNAYYNAVLMDMLVQAADNKYKLSVENQLVVNSQYALGLIPELSYKNADISVDSAKTLYDGYVLSRDIALMNLANLLNIDKNSKIILTDTIEVKEFTSDTKSDIASAMETRYDIIALNKQVELSNEYFSHTKAFTESSAVYNTAYADTVNKQYQLDMAKDNIELAILSQYNKIYTDYCAIALAQRTYDMRFAEYEAAKLQYELGMITNIELTEKINNLYDTQTELFQAKLNYTMSVEKYKYDITIGLPQ